MSELSEVSRGVGGFREPERAGGVGCRGRGSAGSLDEVTWKRPTSWGFPSSEMGANLASLRSGRAGFAEVSLSVSAVKGEGLSWPQGARRGVGGGRLGKGPGGAGGGWERSPGEGDNRDWATVITASEKALAKERSGAAVVEGRGEAEEHGGKEGGVRVTWEQLGEKADGELGGRELCGN